eukprot:989733_1
MSAGDAQSQSQGGIPNAKAKANLQETHYSEEAKANESLMVNQRQSSAISNYSTLRTNRQWDQATISSMIDKMASVTMLPPGIDTNKTVIFRERAVLEQEKYQLQHTQKDTPKLSCQSIIKYVQSREAHDPMLSDDNPHKPKKEEDDDEKEDLDHDSSDSSENDESVPISKVYELASLDVLVTKEETEKKDAIADLFDRKEDELPTDEMLEDPCYRHLIEELGRAGLQATDNKNKAKQVPKSIILKKIKKATKLTYVIGSRVFSLFDIVTDALLLYTSSLNDDLWFFTLGLV